MTAQSHPASLQTGLVSTPQHSVLVVAIVRLVVLMRRHERDHDRLVDRVRAYETRLLELRAHRQRFA